MYILISMASYKYRKLRGKKFACEEKKVLQSWVKKRKNNKSHDNYITNVLTYTRSTFFSDCIFGFKDLCPIESTTF